MSGDEMVSEVSYATALGQVMDFIFFSSASFSVLVLHQNGGDGFHLPFEQFWI